MSQQSTAYRLLCKAVEAGMHSDCSSGNRYRTMVIKPDTPIEISKLITPGFEIPYIRFLFDIFFYCPLKRLLKNM